MTACIQSDSFRIWLSGVPGQQSQVMQCSPVTADLLAMDLNVTVGPVSSLSHFLSEELFARTITLHGTADSYVARASPQSGRLTIQL